MKNTTIQRHISQIRETRKQIKKLPEERVDVVARFEQRADVNLLDNVEMRVKKERYIRGIENGVQLVHVQIVDI